MLHDVTRVWPGLGDNDARIRDPCQHGPHSPHSPQPAACQNVSNDLFEADLFILVNVCSLSLVKMSCKQCKHLDPPVGISNKVFIQPRVASQPDSKLYCNHHLARLVQIRFLKTGAVICKWKGNWINVIFCQINFWWPNALWWACALCSTTPILESSSLTYLFHENYDFQAKFKCLSSLLALRYLQRRPLKCKGFPNWFVFGLNMLSATWGEYEMLFKKQQVK